MRAASTVLYHSAILSNWPVRRTKWAYLAGLIGCVAGARWRTFVMTSFIAGLPSGGRAGAQPTPARALPRDGVVTGAREFDQIEAVAERIGHVRHAAVIGVLDRPVEGGAERGQPRHGRVDVRHDEIEMHRCPMAAKIAPDLCTAELCRRRPVAEQKDRQIGAGELDPARTQAALQREAEPITIERDAAFELGDINIG